MHFQGNWKLGNLEGCNGTSYDVVTSESYYGCWHKSLFNGYGSYTFVTGYCYEGNFIDGVKQGNGSFTTG